jgi:DNA-binding transcriptional LysR family regulator
VAELAVIGENTPVEGLDTQVCHVDELMLLVPAGHALAPAGGDASVPLARVLEQDLVAFGRSTSLTRQLAAEAEALQRPLRIRAQIRGFDAMARMVAAGVGLAILPRDAAMPYLQPLGLVLRPVSGMRARRLLLWVMRDRAALTPAARSLVEMAGPLR